HPCLLTSWPFTSVKHPSLVVQETTSFHPVNERGRVIEIRMKKVPHLSVLFEWVFHFSSVGLGLILFFHYLT
ncbi:MAG: hypothetical protein KZQ92_10125, partial [Candidatus Thiodiazotropha sp. (ex Lucinoma borealis)]|nr:hypothetical protein [Candidatus Thiodiazotropha sp. (ex Lucinoma borealis)]